MEEDDEEEKGEAPKKKTQGNEEEEETDVRLGNIRVRVRDSSVLVSGDLQ